MGAWLSYGLGKLTDNLPTFVVLPDPRGLPYNQTGNFTCGFLPAAHQGTIFDAAASPPVADLAPSEKVNFVTRRSGPRGPRLARSIEPPICHGSTRRFPA